MKPPFKDGQEIVCVVSGDWVYEKVFIKTILGLFGKKKKPGIGPKDKEHCWVVRSYYGEGIWYIYLFGYGDRGYNSTCFRAIESNSISLSEQAKEVIKENLILHN